MSINFIKRKWTTKNIFLLRPWLKVVAKNSKGSYHHHSWVFTFSVHHSMLAVPYRNAGFQNRFLSLHLMNKEKNIIHFYSKHFFSKSWWFNHLIFSWKKNIFKDIAQKILFSRFVKSQATVIGTVHKETAHFIHIKWHLTLVLSTARHYLIFICFPTCAKKVSLVFLCSKTPPPLHRCI